MQVGIAHQVSWERQSWDAQCMVLKHPLKPAAHPPSAQQCKVSLSGSAGDAELQDHVLWSPHGCSAEERLS